MSQFSSVAQFYQCLLCFALPLLIIQQCYLWLRSVNKRYQDIRFSHFQQQLKWAERTLLERQVGKPAAELQQSQYQNKAQQIQQSQRPVRSQLAQQKTQQVRQKSNSRGFSDQNGQGMQQRQYQDNQNRQQRRRSTLPQMVAIETIRKSQQAIEESNQNKQQKVHFMSEQEKAVENQRQKPLSLEQQEKIQRAMRYIVRIDVAFEQYIPIIMTVLVMGILTHSVYVFSMVCFFGYAFSSLLFNYADLLSKLRRGLTRSSIFAKLNYLFSGFFIITLFVSYFIDQEYNLTI